MAEAKDLLAGLDGPRPLSRDLRERLEQQLVGSERPLPLQPALAERLTDELTDPVADLLHDLDAPRQLSPQLRAVLATGLAAPRRRWVLASAAASIAAAVVVALVLGGPDERRPQPDAAGGPPATRATASPTTGAGGVVGAIGGLDGRPSPHITMDGAPVLAPPDPGAAQPPPAFGGSGAGHPSYGYYQPPDAPAAMPPDGQPAPASAPPPQVTSRSPDAGPIGGGTTVRIRGSRLGTADHVTFGEAVGRSLRVIDDEELTVVSPPHPAGTVSFVVHFRDGGSFVVSAGFTYLKAPQLDSVSPASGSVRGGSWVVLSGEALSRVTTVRFGDTVAPRIEVLSDTALRVLTPPHPLGPVDINASSPGGSSNAIRFVYLP